MYCIGRFALQGRMLSCLVADPHRLRHRIGLFLFCPPSPCGHASSAMQFIPPFHHPVPRFSSPVAVINLEARLWPM